MITATRNWFKRNRTNFAIGASVIGAGYFAVNYVVGKITEARQQMSEEKISRENLRRRFEQNQEDCTFTVLAILPTAYENIVEALPVEETLAELQKHRDDRIARSANNVTELTGLQSENQSQSQSQSQQAAPPSDDAKSLASTNFTTDSYIHASQTASSSIGDGAQQSKQKKSKQSLWYEMKISAIARTFTLIYTLALLNLLTRIQLNLLGRRNYLASVIALASPPKQGSKIQLENRDDDNPENAFGNDFDTNRKYLSFSWWLLNKGCKDIMEEVISAVKKVFGPINPREDLTLERLSELCVEVRKIVEGATEQERIQKRWLHYLLPSISDEDYVLRASGMRSQLDDTGLSSPSIRKLMDETSDLIDSPSFSHVITLLLDSGFSLLVDNKIASAAYKMPIPSAEPERIVEIVGNDAKARLAQSMSVFSRQAHIVGSGSSNDYLTAMESVKDLSAFAAVVYSSNFEYELPDEVAAVRNGTEAPVSNTSTSLTPAVKATLPTENVPDIGKDGEVLDGDFQKAWEKAWGKVGK